MIYVKPIDNDYKNGFTVEGHAGYAEHGFDIVCAGASTVIRTSYHMLSLVSMLTINFAEGDASIQIHNPSEVTDVIMQGAIDTYEELCLLYPDNIQLEEDMSYVKK